MPLSNFARQAARRQPGFQATRPLVALGGLNEDENPQSLASTDLRLAFNCARKGSMTGTRPGVNYGESDFDAAITSAKPIQGMYEYIRLQGSSRNVLVVSEAEAYLDHDSGAMDKSAITMTGVGNDSPWRFASYQNKVFAAGGDDGDSFWYYDGNNSGSPTSATLAPVALLNSAAAAMDVKFVFEKWNMLFVGGMNGTLFDDNPMVAGYCDYATDATEPANYKISNIIPGQLLGENFGIGSYGSEFMTGFGSYADNEVDALLFLTNKRIVSILPNPNLTSNADAFRISDTIATGCVNQDAFVNLGLDVGDAVYLSEDGVHSMAQSQQFGDRVTQYLSWPIRKTFERLNMSRSKYFTGAYWPREGMVLFSVSTGSNATNDLILCMDIKGAERLSPGTIRWYKWELNGLTANRIVPMRGSDGIPYPYVGGNAGEVCRFERNVYEDLSSSGLINCQFRTKDEDFGIPSREKHVGDAYISLQGLGDYTIDHTYVFDDGLVNGQTSRLEVPNTGSKWGTAKWGTATWGSEDSTKRHRVPGIGSSVTVSHRFSHTGASEPWWVGLINQEIMVSGPTDDAEANTVGS